MRLCPEPRVHVHGHGEELLQGGNRLEQQNDDPATLDSFHRPGQQVRGQGFEVLENAHPVSASKDLVRLLVVAVPGIGKITIKI